jgi:L-threonylcarbamoyladenylate synthase
MNVFDVGERLGDDVLATAERTLAEDHLVVLPTDTVYGVAGRPDRPGATDRIFAAKRRPRDLTLPVLVPDRRSAESVAVFDASARILADRFWPGSVTLVLPRASMAGGWDLGHERTTVGVRVPAHDVALALLARTGPLAVTSANRSGEPPSADCAGVQAALGGAVALYLCAGPCAGTPSTVVDLTGAEVLIRRDGAVDAARIRAALGS